MNYMEALAYINDKDKFGSRPNLDSITKLLELLDNPQDILKIIHVGGTNGKGSTSSYIANCIMEAGYSVGLFTSPYLERFNERIRMNWEEIGDGDLARICSRVRDAADKMSELGFEHPTTFVIITAIAFVYYGETNPDYVVLEVGLGGRFDSTNVIKSSLASVITTIDFDHINELGDTLEKIAFQKAGIIKENGLVISYRQGEEATRVLREVAEEKNAEFHICPNVEIAEEDDFGSTFNYKYMDEILDNIRINMIGEYQIYNASLAITSLLVLRKKGLVKISNENIYRGIEKTKWNGRLEVLSRKPTFLIDGAHNLQGIKNLAKALELFSYNKLILGVAIVKDKDVDNMLEELAPLADTIIATEVKIPRKIPANELAKKISRTNSNVIVEESIKNAISRAYEIAQENDLIVFGGSLYLIGEVRTLVNSHS